MLAFRVEIDGELAHVAGVADWSLLAMHITASRGDATAPVESAMQHDSLQALQLATDLESVLKRLSNKWDFYYPTGEGYFDE
ncbi:MAG TPA: hypothetical protein VGE92_02590 [Steroidobacteraceae bacterium]